MSDPPKRPHSPVVAIDPSLEGQYAATHIAASNQQLVGPSSPDDFRGNLEPPHKRRARSAAEARSSVHSAASVTLDYNDRLLHLLNGTSGSLLSTPPPPPPPSRRSPLSSAATTATAAPAFTRDVPGLVSSNAFETRLDIASATQRSGQSSVDLYELRPDYGFAQLGPPGQDRHRSLAVRAPEPLRGPSTIASMTSPADAPRPPVAGPSRPSSARASPATPSTLPDRFPEPPTPVNVEDGTVPLRSDFAEALAAYIESLHPIKRNKALSTPLSSSACCRPGRRDVNLRPQAHRL